MRKFLDEHQTIASVVTIIVSLAAFNAWLTSDIRADTKATNARIDSLFHYVLTKQEMTTKGDD